MSMAASTLRPDSAAMRALRRGLFCLFALLALPALPAAAQEVPAAADDAGGEEAEPVRSPLSPAPTGSPRQTFQSFRSLAQGAADALMAAFDASEQDNSLFDTAEVRGLKREAMTLLNRAASTLDLSSIPPANRRTVGISAVLQLEEIMDRIKLPNVADIPGEAAVEAGAAPTGWTLPGTEIRMTRVETPSGEQRFVFSTETVQRLPAFYALVKDLPRQSPEAIDFYQHFVSAPGLSMPIEVYRYVLQLPEWALDIYYEQAIWQWIALVIAAAVFLAVVLLVLRWDARRPQAGGTLGSALRRLFSPLFVLGALILFKRVADDGINLTGDVLASVELVVESLQAIAFAVLAVFGFNLIAAFIISSPRIRSESLDASLIRLVLRVLGFVVAGYIVFLGATQVGLPAYGIVAGLGVGGLAIALAVRPTLENFIGGIILYADRPVKVGDFCKFGEMLGTVEEIGLRSTKVRGLDRTLVTVQNSEFAQMSLTNYTRRDANLMTTTIRLRYETTSPQLAAIIDALATMLREDPRVDENTVRVCFRGFGAYSLDVEIWCYVRISDWTRFLKAQEDLFMKVMTIVEEGGSSFAIPSQTTYLGTDHPPGAAEAEDPPRLVAPANGEGLAGQTS